MPTPPWIGLAGPTASGKSSAALMLAQHFPIEVISVDSALVYCGMDIGTAKPSAQERRAVPHHLIDLLAPQQSYSAARFVADAQVLIPQVRARGRWPLLVGGTMLYFKALMDGLAAMPAADPEVRQAIEQEAQERGWPALHAELLVVDAPTAARLQPTDAQRIQRALEVWRSTGVPISQFHQQKQAAPGWRATALISLEPRDRSLLHARIAQRFDAMLARGFLDEVRGLRAQGGLHADLPSMRCVGYRQAWQALDEGLEGTALIHAVRQRGIAATRQLAKRQLTWLRSMPQRRVLACDEDPSTLQAQLIQAMATAA